MNRVELINAIVEKTDYSKKSVTEMLRAYKEVVIETVAGGEDVAYVGFGTFQRQEKAARECFNPQTKEKIKVPMRMYPKFRPSGEFKKACNPDD